MNNRRTRFTLKTLTGASLITAVLACIPAETQAYSSGLIGQTTNGCTCHFNQSDETSLTLTSSTGTFEVEPGGTLTLTLQVAHASQQAAGTNIVVRDASNAKAGTLAPDDADLQLVSSELTHRSPKGMVNGRTTFTFTWTAPSTPGTYTLYAAGNAVNLNGNTSGDFYNLMSQTITVGPTTDVRDNTTVAGALLRSVEVAPNPAPAVDGAAELRFSLERAATVTVELFDAAGRPVQPAQSVHLNAGDHREMIDTRQLSAGMYVAVLRSGNEQIAKHFTVVR